MAGTWVARSALVVLAAAVLALAGCAAATVTDPAAATVQKALELRRDQVKDVASYAPRFEESAVATALADAAKASTTTVAPIPEWQAPYVSKEETARAEVVVVWVVDKTHPGWASATLFALRRDAAGWVISDAQDVATGAIPKPLKTR